MSPEFQAAIAALALIAAAPNANTETASDAPPRSPMGQLVELARQNMMSAVEAANKRVGSCADLGKATFAHDNVQLRRRPETHRRATQRLDAFPDCSHPGRFCILAGWKPAVPRAIKSDFSKF